MYYFLQTETELKKYEIEFDAEQLQELKKELINKNTGVETYFIILIDELLKGNQLAIKEIFQTKLLKDSEDDNETIINYCYLKINELINFKLLSIIPVERVSNYSLPDGYSKTSLQRIRKQ